MLKNTRVWSTLPLQVASSPSPRNQQALAPPSGSWGSLCGKILCAGCGDRECRCALAAAKSSPEPLLMRRLRSKTLAWCLLLAGAERRGCQWRCFLPQFLQGLSHLTSLKPTRYARPRLLRCAGCGEKLCSAAFSEPRREFGPPHLDALGRPRPALKNARARWHAQTDQQSRTCAMPEPPPQFLASPGLP